REPATANSRNGGSLVLVRIRYSRWDGTQDPFGPDLSAGDLLDSMSQEILSGAGADSALSRLLRRGIRGQFSGLDALRARLRRARRSEQDRLSLAGPPEDLQRLASMLSELNSMIEARERGDPVDFEGFMQRYGDFFPGNPRSLDELLEQMARRMAALSRLLASLSPEQRRELQELAEQLLQDMDLAFEADR